MSRWKYNNTSTWNKLISMFFLIKLIRKTIHHYNFIDSFQGTLPHFTLCMSMIMDMYWDIMESLAYTYKKRHTYKIYFSLIWSRLHYNLFKFICTVLLTLSPQYLCMIFNTAFKQFTNSLVYAAMDISLDLNWNLNLGLDNY